MRESQEPSKRQNDSPIGGTIEEHPAYGNISVSRVSSGAGSVLYGSDFVHRQFVTIEISDSALHRSTHYDRYHSGKGYIKVALSEAQWATFVSAIGVGDGVPCTVEWVRGDGWLPTIPNPEDRREQFRQELEERLDIARRGLEDLAVLVEKEGGKVAMRDALRRVAQNIGTNLDFVLESADEHMEKTVERAKIEVSSYLTQALARAGLESLQQGDKPLIEIEAPKE